MRYIINNKNPIDYYNFLFNCLFTISGSKFNKIQADIEVLISNLLQELEKLQEASNDSKVTELIIETIPHIPMQAKKMSASLHIMLRSSILGLKGPESVQKTCIKSILSYLSRLSYDSLYSLLQRDAYKDQLIPALHQLAVSSSFPRSILTMNVFGILAGRARRELKGKLSFSTYDQPEPGLPLLMCWNTSNDKNASQNYFVFPLDIYIQLCSDVLLRNLIIEDPKTNNKRIFRSTRFDEEGLLSLRQTRVNAKEQVVTFLAQCFYAFVNKSVFPEQWQGPDSIDINMDMPSKNDQENPFSEYENKAMCRILYSLFMAYSDFEVKDKAFAVLEDILQYLVYLILHYTISSQSTTKNEEIPESKGQMSKYELFYMKTQYGPIPPLLPLSIVHDSLHLSLLCLSEALTSLYMNNHVTITNNANIVCCYEGFQIV